MPRGVWLGGAEGRGGFPWDCCFAVAGPCEHSGDPAAPTKFSTTMEGGTILHWLKRGEDPVVKEKPLFEMETNKATVEVEAPFSARLARFLALAGC